MVTFQPAARARGRALLSGAVACLLMLRALVAIVADAPTSFAAVGFGEAAAAAQCADERSDRSSGPHAPGERHCHACLTGDRQRAGDAVLPIVVEAATGRGAPSPVGALPQPRAGPRPRACGWIGSWSSRAPPRV